MGNMVAMATTWLDKKQVAILHNHFVGFSEDYKVFRYDKKKRRRVPVPAPEIITEYAGHMNGVDHKDRDTADYSVSIRSNRYYLRIWFWLIDSRVHAMYTIVVELVKKGSRLAWNMYNQTLGRFRFQINLSQQLMEEGIRMDWPEPFREEDRPSWMRQRGLVACDCGTCFFCKLPPPQKPAAAGKKPGKCVTERDDVTKNPERCRLCYLQIRLSNPEMSRDDVDKLCHHTRLGCSNCGVNICEGHWGLYEHDMVGKHKKIK